MEKAPVRIGFIGSGGLAKHHMAQVASDGAATIAAICDVNTEATREPVERYGARAYSNHREMLDAQTLDAAYVAVPPFAHGEIEMDLCRAGLPFFVEKPVAKEMETARRIEAAVRDAGLITCVGYQLRYFPTAARLKKRLAGEAVGMGVGRYWCGFTQEMGRGWLIQRELSGGQIIEQATHLIDMVRFLAGEVVEAYGAQAKMLRGGGDCPDVNAALLKLRSGGAVTLTASWGTGDPGDWSQTNALQLFWDRFRADWNPGSLSITPDDAARPEEAGEEETGEGESIDAVFLKAIRSGDGSGVLSSYSDAVKSLAVSVAIEEAAATGRPVPLG